MDADVLATHAYLHVACMVFIYVYIHVAFGLERRLWAGATAGERATIQTIGYGGC